MISSTVRQFSTWRPQLERAVGAGTQAGWSVEAQPCVKAPRARKSSGFLRILPSPEGDPETKLETQGTTRQRVIAKLLAASQPTHLFPHPLLPAFLSVTTETQRPFLDDDSSCDVLVVNTTTANNDNNHNNNNQQQLRFYHCMRFTSRS